MSPRIAWILAAALAAACGPSGSPLGSEGGRCRLDGSCDVGLTCGADNVCHLASTADGGPRADAGQRPDAVARGTADAPPLVPLPDAAVSGVGVFHATWSITVNGAAATCGDVGAATVELAVTPSGGGRTTIASFNCDNGSGTTRGFEPGGYTIAARLLGPQKQVLASPNLSGTAVANQTTNLAAVTYAFTVQTGGTFSATWDIFVGAGRAACADVGADTFELESTPRSGGASVVDVFDCADGSGTTFDLQPGSYQVTARLRDANGDPLGEADFGTHTIASGADTNLGNIEFDFPATFGRIFLTWSISQGPFLADCGDVGASFVEVSSYPVGSNDVFVDQFDCSSHAGTTDALAPGSYDVYVDLLDFAGVALSQEVVQFDVPVSAGADTDIGDFRFAF